MKECVNCGEGFVSGHGFPMEDNQRWECCCSMKCWMEFNDVDEPPVSFVFDNEK